MSHNFDTSNYGWVMSLDLALICEMCNLQIWLMDIKVQINLGLTDLYPFSVTH